ncbi:MAG: hypothetical protein IT288_08890 [Bdellovibrionales bacterium]|nr:hypothetical protein [Bdellovibrionales bacterium]
MSKLLLAICVSIGLTALAHDEGHGPKVADTGKYGGLVSAVVLKADAKKGASAALVHKAELVRGADGLVQIYLYDDKMKPLDVSAFEAKGSAVMAAKVKGKWKDTEFPLELKQKAFEGKLPKIESKPFNIDVTLKAGGKELLSAFDDLD